MEATTRKEIIELLNNFTAVNLLSDEGYYSVEKFGIADSFAALTDEESGVCLSDESRDTIRRALARYNDLLDDVQAILHSIKENKPQ
ncbi:MAG: hypothetical protein IJV05_06050 [Muribaculaceae bacterium]|nr:hypothetical protein [Muribaculaceae bacterium]